MKIALIAGWVMLAVEVGIATMMATGADGGDAAGQGMAKGFAMLAAPFLLIAAGLLTWAQLTGHPWGVWGGTAIVGAPIGVALLVSLPNLVPNFGRLIYSAQAGSFADSRLTRIAGAIRKNEFERERELVKAGPVDWTARDRHEKTLLDIALEHNADPYVPKGSRVEGLRILLEAGARPDGKQMAFALGTELTSLEALLEAGADVNAKDDDGTPIAFLGYVTPEKMAVLLKYGVDVNATDPDPLHDQRSLLMHHVDGANWDVARMLRDHGANLNYRTPGGMTLERMLKDRDNEYTRQFASEIGILR